MSLSASKLYLSSAFVPFPGSVAGSSSYSLTSNSDICIADRLASAAFSQIEAESARPLSGFSIGEVFWLGVQDTA
ncbi:hypothetical protein ASPZODRAFT_12294 [Penicilliopsis zonata CBS 506.65]|uniref:Uncharacterized protein n=1 Tax=Penicilliopsis zonata CBS 506.65 TaxID=1073090 RepID=A0A1L9SWQ6_9EURO|nr:hypothetical protein ASPZODRAFT_12294 [Penicilliopsis zonata CBS 506.65]OJJ51473.1 hypothetical protein ASPZODRAFT_12294 [Penicilliopsis zonata CBS 506.65]